MQITDRQITPKPDNTEQSNELLQRNDEFHPLYFEGFAFCTFIDKELPRSEMPMYPTLTERESCLKPWPEGDFMKGAEQSCTVEGIKLNYKE
ncbi:hypothetical protein chiPu_0003669 [Chiloscyllium punctatum]|uniref:Uncharacterized protein n=1 Tax=Chiloscyllium punctatum TaxID=137246 RepID=A0A401S4F2_CHIPU|nr:hypothetical protein [Chiloscyllium punctatum]